MLPFLRPLGLLIILSGFYIGYRIYRLPHRNTWADQYLRPQAWALPVLLVLLGIGMLIGKFTFGLG